MEATKELLKLLLPDDLRDSFEIVDVKKVPRLTLARMVNEETEKLMRESKQQ